MGSKDVSHGCEVSPSLHHLPLAGSFVPLQLALARSIAVDPKYDPPGGRLAPFPADGVSGPHPPIDVVEIQHLNLSYGGVDGSYETGNSHLLQVSLARYIRSLGREERTRLITVLYPCVLLAVTQGLRLRITLVGFGKHADQELEGAVRCLPVVNLVTPCGVDHPVTRPLAHPMAPGAVWLGAFFDVHSPSTEPVAFQLVVARFEALLVLAAVLALSAVEGVHTRAYEAVASSGPVLTQLVVRIHVVSPEQVEGGGRPVGLTVVDGATGLRLVHRRDRHQDLAPLVPLDRLLVRLAVCPSCGATGGTAVRPAGAPQCHRCGLTVDDCWAPSPPRPPEGPVVLHLRTPRHHPRP